MDTRALILLIFSIWAIAMTAFVYASVRRIPYFAAISVCAAWTSAMVLCMLFNFWLADLLELSMRSSGFVRGKETVGPYGFFVTILLIVEIGALVAISRNLKASKPKLPAQHPVPEPSVDRAAIPFSRLPLTAPIPRSYERSAYPVRTYRITGALIFFLCSSAGNFALAVKALQQSMFGLIFVIIAIGLLIAAYNESVE